MRKKIIAANWKMNLTYTEAMTLTDTLVDASFELSPAEVILAAPFVYLHDLVGRIQSQPSFSIAAQNCSSEEKGAFTGEISASMLVSIGTEFVLIGHSERRTIFGENDTLIAKKLKVALDNGLIPIFCCGEDIHQRNSNNHFKKVEEQLNYGLFSLDLSLVSKCIIAYEPVWAIGTGVTASTEQAQEMHAFIRTKLKSKYNASIAELIPILYGGSVTSKNSTELFSCVDVDGGLVGGASLKAAEFLSIIQSMYNLQKVKN
jgi:triosephosphate isomerase